MIGSRISAEPRFVQAKLFETRNHLVSRVQPSRSRSLPLTPAFSMVVIPRFEILITALITNDFNWKILSKVSSQ